VKTFAPTTYAVGREKVKEYALAVGETSPLHLDHRAAREAGFADVVAPPMFAVVFSAPAVGPALFDPEVGMDFARMVHGGQRFEWGPLVVAGDEIETVARFDGTEAKGAMTFFRFTTTSTRLSDGAVVATGTWTNIVRG
jgi:acyl dehydratase